MARDEALAHKKAWDTRGRAAQGDPEAIEAANRRILTARPVSTALAYYVGDSQTINRYLRRNIPTRPVVMDAAETLRDALQKCRLPHDAILLRGAGQRARKLIESLGEGDVFKDDGIISTSDDEDISRRFLRPDPRDRVAVMLRIETRRGQKGASTVGVGGLHEERETLLAPGSRFRVIRKNPILAPQYLHGEEVRIRIIDVELLDD